MFEKTRWCVFCNGEHARTESCEWRTSHERDRDERAHQLLRDLRLAAALRKDVLRRSFDWRRTA
jgi:hypothetical protein